MNRFSINNNNSNIYECNYTNDIQYAKDQYYKKQKCQKINMSIQKRYIQDFKK